MFDILGLPMELLIMIIEWAVINETDIMPFVQLKKRRPINPQQICLRKPRGSTRTPSPPPPLNRPKLAATRYLAMHPNLALLGVCKLLYALGRPILYECNTWRITRIPKQKEAQHARVMNFWTQHIKLMKHLSFNPSFFDERPMRDHELDLYFGAKRQKQWAERFLILRDAPIKTLTMDVKDLWRNGGRTSWAVTEFVEELHRHMFTSKKVDWTTLEEGDERCLEKRAEKGALIRIRGFDDRMEKKILAGITQ